MDLDLHQSDCPDVVELAGPHSVCPCPHCMDTGFVGADLREIECDCSASLQSAIEQYAEIARLATIGCLIDGLFVGSVSP